MYGAHDMRPWWGKHAQDGEWNDINGSWEGPAVYQVGNGAAPMTAQRSEPFDILSGMWFSVEKDTGHPNGDRYEFRCTGSRYFIVRPPGKGAKNEKDYFTFDGTTGRHVSGATCTLLPSGDLHWDLEGGKWVSRREDGGKGGGKGGVAPMTAQMDREGGGGGGGFRYAEPPNNVAPIHPEGDTFFWRYYKADGELCPCEHSACCMALCCAEGAACEIETFTVQDENDGGVGAGISACQMWLILGLIAAPCMIAEQRNNIETKIHKFHRQRGDPRAQGAPVKAGNGVICVGVICPFANSIMHAQNYWVMKQFQRVQAPYAGAHWV